MRHIARPDASGSEAVGSQRIAAPDRLALGLCAAAITFLVWGCITSIKRHPAEVSTLRVADPSEPALSGTGFAPNAVYKSTVKPSVSGPLNFYGSWLGSDTSTGSAHTAWYLPVPRFYIFVSGYPNHKGNQLLVEAESRNGAVVRVPVVPANDPMEYWATQRVSLAKLNGVTKFRLVAIDGSAAVGGWLGFSQPFVIPGGYGLPIMKEMLLVALSTAAAIVIFLGPGLVLRQLLFRRLNYNLSFIWTPIPGLLGLAVVGLIAWCGPNELSSRLISKVSLVVLTIYITYRLARVPLSTYTTYIERRVLLVALVLAAIAVSKATYSRGPIGELFSNTVSRTLEVGGRSDSRLPYHVVQLVAWRAKPFSDLGRFLYSSYGVWNFSHRGALSAIAVSPLVLAGPVRVPAVMPDQPWTVFDAEGFSAFRIGMIVMACCSLLMVFGISKLFLPDEWAFLAFLVAVTAPFVVHEIYFTWPKLEAGAFALLAAYLIFRFRYFEAGLAVGLGYLCHPSALVSIPSLVALILLWPGPPALHRQHWPKKIYVWIVRTLLMAAGCAIWVLVWRVVNGKHFAQGQFFSYFVQANGWHPTARQWIHHRIDSIWKTFVPLHVFMFHQTDRDAVSVYGHTPASVIFCLQYWTTLPFGAGIAYFVCLLKLLWDAFVKVRGWLLWIFCIPVALFALYWGPADTGLLREGLHTWFLGLMIFSVCILKKFEMQSSRFWRFCNWALLSRAVAVPVMLLLPTISFPPHSPIQREFALSDIAALLTMVVGSAGLCVYMFRYAEALRTKAQPSEMGEQISQTSIS